MTTKKGNIYPPKPYLRLICDHCPRALSIYFDLWENMSDLNRVKVYVKNISLEYLTTPTKFRNQLSYLVKEGLISVHENSDVHDDFQDRYYVIEIVGWTKEDEAACW